MQAAALMQAFTPAFQNTDAKRSAVRGAAAAFLGNLARRHGQYAPCLTLDLLCTAAQAEWLLCAGCLSCMI